MRDDNIGAADTLDPLSDSAPLRPADSTPFGSPRIRCTSTEVVAWLSHFMADSRVR